MESPGGQSEFSDENEKEEGAGDGDEDEDKGLLLVWAL
jgi:hypothetical protein